MVPGRVAAVILDLRGHDAAVGRLHRRFDAGGLSIGYAYIRKNACSSFKAAFPQWDVVTRPPVEETDAQVVVLRDPVERLVGLFRNKFIQRAGNADIFAAYRDTTGKDPDEASFADLVVYVRSGGVDPHVWTQRSHLYAIRYSHATLIQDLHSTMVELVGAEAAMPFSRRVNSTGHLATYDTPAAHVPASTLREHLLGSKQIPSTDALTTPALRESIADAYASDYALLESLRTAPA